MQNRFLTLTKVFDLIVHMARNLHDGKSADYDQGELSKKYTQSEISAAYSWLLQKQDEGKFNTKPNPKLSNHRVLHFAEQMVITPDAYGYLMELIKLKILDHGEVESIIEKVMMTGMEVYDLEKMKQLVSLYVIEVNEPKGPVNFYLKGNETVN